MGVHAVGQNQGRLRQSRKQKCFFVRHTAQSVPVDQEIRETFCFLRTREFAAFVRLSRSTQKSWIHMSGSRILLQGKGGQG